MKLTLLGAPGAGKGTQAEILSKKLSIPTISTGAILRGAIHDGTPVGKQAEAYIQAGKLVPDEVIIGIVKERLAKPDCAGGYILDGMPRTIPQAQALIDNGIDLDAAVSLEVSDQEIIQRMSGRRSCPQCGATYHAVNKPPRVEGKCDVCGTALTVRADDAPETVQARLNVYHEQTEPLKDFYEKLGKLRTVESVPGIEAMSRRVFQILGIGEA